MAKSSSSRVHILFISAAVAEGGILHQGYLLWLYCGEIPRSLYRNTKMPGVLPEVSLKYKKIKCIEFIHYRHTQSTANLFSKY